jgi:hypothetical protein
MRYIGLVGSTIYVLHMYNTQVYSLYILVALFLYHLQMSRMCALCTTCTMFFNMYAISTSYVRYQLSGVQYLQDKFLKVNFYARCAVSTARIWGECWAGQTAWGWARVPATTAHSSFPFSRTKSVPGHPLHVLSSVTTRVVL